MTSAGANRRITIDADVPSVLLKDTGELPAISVQLHPPTIAQSEGEAETRNITTRVVFLLDKSGSRYPEASDVRGGFNTYIKKLQADTENAYTVSLFQFDTSVETTFLDTTPSDILSLDEKSYSPGGSTALYDAIDTVLQNLKDRWGTPNHHYGSDPVIFIVDTDGQENASKRTTRAQVFEEISSREKAGNWTFVYMGTKQDAWANSAGIGLQQGNVISYNATNTRGMYEQLAAATSASATSSRTSGVMSTSHFFSNGTTANSGIEVTGTANQSTNVIIDQTGTIVVPLTFGNRCN